MIILLYKFNDNIYTPAVTGGRDIMLEYESQGGATTQQRSGDQQGVRWCNSILSSSRA